MCDLSHSFQNLSFLFFQNKSFFKTEAKFLEWLCMYIKYSLKNEVTFKITIRRMIDQMIILRTTLFFDGHLMYM
jgi:hypothetical protein